MGKQGSQPRFGLYIEDVRIGKPTPFQETQARRVEKLVDAGAPRLHVAGAKKPPPCHSGDDVRDGHREEEDVPEYPLTLAGPVEEDGEDKAYDDAGEDEQNGEGNRVAQVAEEPVRRRRAEEPLVILKADEGEIGLERIPLRERGEGREADESVDEHGDGDYGRCDQQKGDRPLARECLIASPCKNLPGDGARRSECPGQTLFLLTNPVVGGGLSQSLLGRGHVALGGEGVDDVLVDRGPFFDGRRPMYALGTIALTAQSFIADCRYSLKRAGLQSVRAGWSPSSVEGFLPVLGAADLQPVLEVDLVLRALGGGEAVGKAVVDAGGSRYGSIHSRYSPWRNESFVQSPMICMAPLLSTRYWAA